MDHKISVDSLIEPILAFTMDLDWAPDEVVQASLDLINQAGFKATIFCTHKFDIGQHEAALHPNFETVQPPEKVLEESNALYPNALGVRSHALQISTRYYRLYSAAGLRYSSSYYMFNQQILPFLTTGKIVELPIFFEDDLYFAEFDNFDLKVNDLNMAGPGIKIFNFHPIHLFLNTRSMAHYLEAKPDYQNPNRLKNHIGKKKGARDFFMELLEYAQRSSANSKTLGELNKIIIGKSKI